MRLRRFALHLWRFAWLEARACVFAGAIFFGLAVSAMVPLPINRGDALFVYGAVMTVLFWWFGSESGRDVALVTSFHLLGLGFKLVKVSIGSWSYPDTGLLAIGGVPLYSGFLYAAVGSYVCRAWRLLRLRLTGYRVWTTALISLAIYVNFLASGWLFDVRLALTALLVYVTLGAWVHFSVGGVEYRMPVVVSFLLIAVFLWVAENFGTFLGTWVYPHQAEGWELVHLTKLWAWALLVTVCFTPVATWMQWTVPDRHALRRAAEARIASRKR